MDAEGLSVEEIVQRHLNDPDARVLYEILTAEIRKDMSWFLDWMEEEE